MNLPSELLSPALAYLAVVVVLAVAIQTAIGFGSMLVCVTLGASVWSVPELIPVLIPLSVVQTSYIVARHHRRIAWGLLLRRVLPLMGLGLVVGGALVGASDRPWLRPALGVLVLSLAIRELLRSSAEVVTPPRWASVGALVAAGVVHGIYATGGPLLVWALGRQPLDRGTFRTTLTTVWLILNLVLIGFFVARGQLTEESLLRTTLLLIPMSLGIGLGELLHARVDEDRFRLGVWLVLAVAAVPLVLG